MTRRGSRTLAVTPWRGRIGPTPSTQVDVVRAYLCDSSDLDADFLGVYAVALTASPLAAQDFSNFATTFREYRVRGFKVTYVPRYEGATPPGGEEHGMGAACSSHLSTVPVPLNRNIVLGSFDSRTISTSRTFQVEWRASDISEHNFIPCTSSWAFGGVQIYIDNLTSFFKYGYLKWEWIIEFRYRQ